MARYIKLGTALHTRYGNMRCVSRDDCPCDACFFSHLEDIGKEWKEKRQCYEVFPCNAKDRKDGLDVGFAILPSDFFTNREHYRKQGGDCKTCGLCGYFMRYDDHWMSGDCASITMNKECNDGHNPFRDDYVSLLQVDANEQACALFRAHRTKRVKEYIRQHPDYYKQD